jgi:O-antigen ligase
MSLMALYSLMYTFSRGGYLATSATLLVLLLIRSKKLLVVVLVAAALYPFWAPSSVVHRLDMSTSVDEWGEVSHDRNITSRKAIWSGAIQIIKEHPQGVGFNSFWRYIRRYVPTDDRMGATDAHNNYLRVTAEMGLHGIIVYIWLLLALCVSTWRLLRRSARESFQYMVSLSFLGTMVAIIVANVFSSTFFIHQLNAIFWVLAAVVMRVGRISEEEASLEASRPATADVDSAMKAA